MEQAYTHTSKGKFLGTWLGLCMGLMWVFLLPGTAFAQPQPPFDPVFPATVDYCKGESTPVLITLGTPGSPDYIFTYELVAPATPITSIQTGDAFLTVDLLDAAFDNVLPVGGPFTLQVTIQDNFGFGASQVINIVVNVYDPVAALVAPVPQVCDGTTTTYTADDNAGTITAYAWSVQNPVGVVASISGAADQQTVDVDVAGDGSYELVLESFAATCSEVLVYPVTVVANPPGAFTTSTNTVCADDMEVFEAPVGAGYTYLWETYNPSDPSVSANFSNNSVFNPTIEFLNTDVVSQDIGIRCTVTGDAPTNCVTVIEEVVTVNARPDAAWVATTGGPICSGENFMFTAPDGFAGGTYAWSAVNASSADVMAVIPGNTQSETITFTNTGGAQGQIDIEVLVTTTSGCTRTVTQTVLVDPTPEDFFRDFVNEICTGENYRFRSQPLQASYTWTLTPSDVSVSAVFDDGLGNGADEFITFTNTDVVAHDVVVQLVIANAAGCDETITETVTVHPAPPSVFTTSVPETCNNAIETFDVPAGFASYTWSTRNPSAIGVSALIPPGPLDYEKAITFGNTTGADQTIEIVLELETLEGCTGEIVDTVTIGYTPVAQFVTAPTQVCTGVATQFEQQALAGATYDWEAHNPSDPSVMVIFDDTTAANPMVTISRAEGTTGTSTVDIVATVTTDKGCTSAPIIRTVQVTEFVGLAITPSSGNGDVCEGETYQYTMTNVPGATYAWSVSGAGFSVSSPDLTAQTVTITMDAIPAGIGNAASLDCDVTLNGCTTTVTYNLTGTDPPASWDDAPDDISGTIPAAESPCPTVTYTYQTDRDDLPFTARLWSIPNPAEGTIVGGLPTDAMIDVAWNEGFATGTLQLVTTYGQCTETLTETYNINDVDPILNQVGTVIVDRGNSIFANNTNPTASTTHQWSYTPILGGVPGGLNILTPLAAQTEIEVLPGADGSYQVDYTETLNGCAETVSFIIEVSNCSNVGGTATVDESVICNGETTFLQLNGYNGNIEWQITQTPGVPASWVSIGFFADLPLAPITAATYSNTPGTYYFRASVTQPFVPIGICPAVYSDTVQLDVQNEPTVSAASDTDIELCSGEGDTLGFVVGGALSLQWEISLVDGISGFIDIPGETNDTLVTTPQVVALGKDERWYRLRVEGGCTFSIYSQVIKVTTFQEPTGTGPTPAAATVCVGTPYQFVGASRTGETVGTWVGGDNGSFSTINPLYAGRPRQDPAAFYTPQVSEAGDVVRLAWVLATAPTCNPDSFNFDLTVQAQPSANIGGPPALQVCAPVVQRIEATSLNGTGFFRFAATTPPSGSTALYDTDGNLYVAPPGGAVSDTVLLEVDIADAGNILLIEWVVTDPSGICNPATTTNIDTLEIDVLATVLVGTASVSTPEACARDTVDLTGTIASPGVTGQWAHNGNGSLYSTVFPGNPEDDPNASYIVSPLDAGNEVEFQWILESVVCGGATRTLYDTMAVRKLPEGAIDEDALTANTFCVSDVVGSLSASVTVGEGRWYTSGSGIFLPDDLSAVATYIPDAADAGNLITLYWVVTDTLPACPGLLDTNLVEVFIDFESLGAGSDLDSLESYICVTEATVSLGASLVHGVGVWSTTVGGGGFTNTTNPNAKYIPLASDAGKYIDLTWTVFNGVCPPVTYTDTVFVLRPSLGAFATVLPDICETGGTTPNLGAVATNGTGIWSATISGTPSFGSFVSDDLVTYPNPADWLLDPNARYVPGIGDGGQEVSLNWTVQNDTCAPAVYTRNVRVTKTPEGFFELAEDTVCYNTTVNLAASVTSGVGTWSVINGTGSFGNANAAVTTYNTGLLDSNMTIYFVWSVDNGVCNSIDYVDSVFISRVNGNILGIPGGSLELCVNTSANLQATGGDTYQWSIAPAQPGVLVFDDEFSATPVLNPVGEIPVGNYAILAAITDVSTGCVDVDTFNLEILGGLTMSVDVSSPAVCQFTEVTLTQVGGSGSNVLWSVSPLGSATITDPTSPVTTAFITSAVSVIFSLTDNDLNGCYVEASSPVTVFTPIIPSISGANNCVGNEGELLASFAVPPADAYWFKGDTATARTVYESLGGSPPDPGSDSRWIAADVVGTTAALPADTALGNYTYSFLFISDQGCDTYDEFSFVIREQPVAEFTASNTELQFYSRQVQFTSLSTDEVEAVADLIHVWDFGDPDSGEENLSSDVNPSHSYSTFGVYPVTLYIENSLGCNDILIKPNYITVADPNFNFPTVFTPNGDGLNDYFRPLPNTMDNPEAVLEGIISVESNPNILDMQIFDRWGNLIYQTSSEQSSEEVAGWNGSIGGTPADAGTYTYRVVIDFGSGKGVRTYDGVLRLIR